MTQATSLTARWYERPRSLDPVGHDSEGKPYWKADGVTIRIGEDDKLELSAPRGSYREQLRVEVGDGELRFPLEDLVPLVLERLDIEELAVMICGNEAARRRILDALARRYNDCGIEDDDRRFWIAKAQSEVHDKKLDELTFTMTRIEHAVAQTGYRAMDGIAWGNVLKHIIQDLLRFMGADYAQAREIAEALERHRFEHYKSPFVELKDYLTGIGSVGGARSAWDDARDHWRGQVAALFANVKVPEPVAAEEAV